MTTLSVSGQENIRQIYNQAESEYDIGRIEQAILLLQDNITDFQGNLKQSAYRLLALCWLGLDDTKKAEQATQSLLNADPYYTASPQDPQRFVDMVENLRSGLTAKVTTACETDCSALVRVCIAFAGITGLPEGFRTGNMPSNLNKTGAFTELTGSKYQSQSTYLGRGDILVTKSSGHTVVVLTNGSKYEGPVYPVDYDLGDRVIKYGCEGNDVKLMQEMLLKLGYDLGSWGCDGDFGDCTELALKAFQADAKLDVDGECGPTTLVALEKAVEAHDGVKPTDKIVRISGGNCYIRTAPNTDGKKLGVAHKGDELPFAGGSPTTAGSRCSTRTRRRGCPGSTAGLNNSNSTTKGFAFGQSPIFIFGKRPFLSAFVATIQEHSASVAPS